LPIYFVINNLIKEENEKMPSLKDKQILQELAKRTMEIAAEDVQNQRRTLWSEFNSLQTKQVPVYILDPQGMWKEVCTEKDLECEDELCRVYENWMKLQLYHASFGDDFITEPWVAVRPVLKNKGDFWHRWGIDSNIQRNSKTGAFHLEEALFTKPEDIKRMVLPWDNVDEEKTKKQFDMVRDLFGDIIEVVPDYYPLGEFNLSMMLSHLLGPQGMMFQFYDNPEMVHQICRIISDGAIEVFEKAEKLGWITNRNNTYGTNAPIQAMTYTNELPNPNESLQKLPLNKVWYYTCAQEFEGMSPEMHDEFLIQYMQPFYEKFGLLAYGCCEGLTREIPYLKKIKNLRRVAVSPWANDKKCAEQLGGDYVISWRPNPAEMVSNGFDPERIKNIIKNAREIFEANNCSWEINLKDFITVEYDKDRLQNWVKVVREALE
jgi:hypothetical protein